MSYGGQCLSDRLDDTDHDKLQLACTSPVLGHVPSPITHCNGYNRCRFLASRSDFYFGQSNFATTGEVTKVSESWSHHGLCLVSRCKRAELHSVLLLRYSFVSTSITSSKSSAAVLSLYLA